MDILLLSALTLIAGALVLTLLAAGPALFRRLARSIKRWRHDGR